MKIFDKIKSKSFSKNEEQIINNSEYSFSTTFIGKIGSLFFTIIIARMLLPELFGLYSLALSTILLFTSVSELGIGTAMLTFVSKSLGNKDLKKAKTYFKSLLKLKIYLTILISFVLIFSSKYIAQNYYNKPIYYALLAGALFIPTIGLQGYLSSAFQAENKFKYPMIKEIIFQILRLILIPLMILISLKLFAEEGTIFAIIIGITFCYLVALFSLLVMARDNISFLRSRAGRLDPLEKIRLKKFLLPFSMIIFSGLFFGYVDTLMLGHYVESEFIGYYGASLGLIGAAIALVGAIPGAFLPVFSRLRKKSLENAFKKTLIAVILISSLAAVVTFFIAKYVLLVYGAEYLPATPILKLLSLLILLTSISGLYDVYLTSREKTNIIARMIIFSTILNIFLNWIFITNGLKTGMMQALLGAGTATIISRAVYLFGIIILKKRVSKTTKIL